MAIETNQRDATNSQSTLDFIRKQLFTYDNKFVTNTLENNVDPAATQDVKTGQLVVRNTTSGNIGLAGTANLADVIGVLYVDAQTLAIAGTVQAHYCIKGEVDVAYLDLPGATTLDTTVGNKNLRDILTDLGFVLNTVTEGTKADN